MEFFATHGRFWLPQRQRRVVHGSLTFDEDGIRLDLGDPLRAPQARADGIVSGSPELADEAVVHRSAARRAGDHLAAAPWLEHASRRAAGNVDC
jgi:hypothetical protein